MKAKIFIPILMLILLASMISASDYCYQEWANVSSDCGGLATGKYNYTGDWLTNSSMVIDGDWTTYATPNATFTSTYYLFVNYSKPALSNNNSKWQVISGPAATIRNLTIPFACWNDSTSQIMLNIHSEGGGVSYSCMYNSSHNWVTLLSISDADIYEEGMWWGVEPNATISNCSSGSPVIQFKTYLENYPDTLISTTMEVEFRYWFINSSNANTLTTKFTGDTNYSICISNSSTSFKLNYDLYLKYYSDSSLVNRYYEFASEVNASIVNNITLYSLNDSTGLSDLRMTTKNTDNYDYFSDVLVKLERYYVSEGLWRVVQEWLSDEYGLTTFKIKEINNDYKLLFIDRNNNLLATSSSMRFACTSSICSLTYLLTPSSGGGSTDNLNYLITYNNNTKIISLNWSIPSGNSHTVTLMLRQLKPSGTVYICNTSQYGAGGYIMCNASRYSGTVLLDVTMNSDYVIVMGKMIDLVKDSLSSYIAVGDAGFWTFGIALTAFMAGLLSGVVGAVLAIVASLIFMTYLGIFPAMTSTLVIALVVILGVIIITVSKEGE